MQVREEIAAAGRIGGTMQRTRPSKITIFCNQTISLHGTYYIIADGRITDHLSWDEMLGKIAAITLNGTDIYRSFTLGDKDEGKFWMRPAPKLLTQGNGVFQV